MDFYKVLGIDKNATKSQIEEAYRRLALNYHTDKHVASFKLVADSAAILIKQISVAYNMSSNDNKHADYDSCHFGSSSCSSSM